MNRDDRSLSTAELANASETRKPDEMRGHHDEPVVNKGATAEAPRAPIVAPTPPADRTSRADSAATSSAASSAAGDRAPLFPEKDAVDLRKRWSEVQAGFVDEPRRAVESADSLVADVMKRLAEGFANERANLERQWDRGDNVTTEDLRVALQRYRSFFDRLLSV